MEGVRHGGEHEDEAGRHRGVLEALEEAGCVGVAVLTQQDVREECAEQRHDPGDAEKHVGRLRR